MKRHNDDINSVAFSPDSKTIALGRDDHTITILNLEEGILLKELKGHNGSVRSVAFSPDGKTLASGSSYKTIKMWDSKEGVQI